MTDPHCTLFHQRRTSSMATDSDEPLNNEQAKRLEKAFKRHLRTLGWRPWLKELGLTDVDMVDRVVWLLVMHLILDRTLTTVLTVQLTDPAVPNVRKAEAEVARLPTGSRIRLASASGLISTSCAADLKAVNAARNKLAHYDPTLGYGLQGVPEIASEKAFEACAERGRRALAELVPTFEKLKAARLRELKSAPTEP